MILGRGFCLEDSVIILLLNLHGLLTRSLGQDCLFNLLALAGINIGNDRCLLRVFLLPSTFQFVGVENFLYLSLEASWAF